MKDKKVDPPAVSASAPARDAAVSAAPAVEPPSVSTSASDFADYVSNDFDAQLEREHAAANGLTPDAPAADAVSDEADDYDPVIGGAPIARDDDDSPASGAPPAVAGEPTNADKTSDAVAGETPVAEAKEAAADVPAVAPTEQKPPANRYDPTEKIAVTEGVEWSRADLLKALNVGVGGVSEANAFKSVFGMDAAKAKEVWLPLLTDMRGNPEFAQHVQTAIDDYKSLGSDFAAYMKRAADHYRAETGATSTAAAPAAPAQPQYAQLPPETQAQITQLAEWRKAQESERQIALYKQHEAQAFEQYPVMSANRAIYAMVAQRAQYRIAQGNAQYTLLDAVRELQPELDQLTAAYAAKPTPATPAASAPEIPVLIGGSGAAPAATRPQPGRVKPRTFADPDEATRSWHERDARAAGFN